ncbi:MAG TPA: 50S ribosomal protein L32 [Candidatus Acidoferrales bacterium]|nr:50S ribosomal protein L32 [Candidatus Acidoferrales bacterium]
MSQEPKKRHSRARQGKRRASIKMTITRSVVCPNCGAPQIAHRVCDTCGYYKGTQVIKIKQANASRA